MVKPSLFSLAVVLVCAACGSNKVESKPGGPAPRTNEDGKKEEGETASQAFYKAILTWDDFKLTNSPVASKMPSQSGLGFPQAPSSSHLENLQWRDDLYANYPSSDSTSDQANEESCYDRKVDSVKIRASKDALSLYLDSTECRSSNESGEIISSGTRCVGIDLSGFNGKTPRETSLVGQSIFELCAEASRIEVFTNMKSSSEKPEGESHVWMARMSPSGGPCAWHKDQDGRFQLEGGCHNATLSFNVQQGGKEQAAARTGESLVMTKQSGLVVSAKGKPTWYEAGTAEVEEGPFKSVVTYRAGGANPSVQVNYAGQPLGGPQILYPIDPNFEFEDLSTFSSGDSTEWEQSVGANPQPGSLSSGTSFDSGVSGQPGSFEGGIQFGTGN